MPFETMKTRSRESRKIVIFPKGLVHSFGKKLVLFHIFLKRKNRLNKCALRYPRKKETPL